jgi:hypothetical protein
MLFQSLLLGSAVVWHCFYSLRGDDTRSSGIVSPLIPDPHRSRRELRQQDRGDDSREDKRVGGLNAKLSTNQFLGFQTSP